MTLLGSFVLFAAGVRGIVLTPADIASSGVDWPALAHRAGIGTIATHLTKYETNRWSDTVAFMSSAEGRKFLADCQRLGIDVEHEHHGFEWLLPRGLFASSPELFRMDASGRRVPDFNCCASSARARVIMAANAVKFAKECPQTTNRYFFWPSDGGAGCHCGECRAYSLSEQALLVENEIVAALRREVDPSARLAHLAYARHFDVPRKVRPADGMFLEFAPFYRHWFEPVHGYNLARLASLLEVFPARDAQVLEYWLDSSRMNKRHRHDKPAPWYPEVFKQDVAAYRRLGVGNFTTFAVDLDAAYARRFGDIEPMVRAYALGLLEGGNLTDGCPAAK